MRWFGRQLVRIPAVRQTSAQRYGADAAAQDAVGLHADARPAPRDSVARAWFARIPAAPRVWAATAIKWTR